MHGSSLDYRRDAGIKHPRYGLYLDTHRGEHTWILVSTRALMLLTLLMAVVVAVVAFGPWLAAT